MFCYKIAEASFEISFSVLFCYKIAEASFLFQLSALFPVSSLCGISLMIDGIGKCIGLCILPDIISIPNYTIVLILKPIMKLSVGCMNVCKR
jgi:hypothetical protein